MAVGGIIGGVSKLGAAGGSSQTSYQPWAGGIGSKILGPGGDPLGSGIGLINMARQGRLKRDELEYNKELKQKELGLQDRELFMKQQAQNFAIQGEQGKRDWQRKFAKAMRGV